MKHKPGTSNAQHFLEDHMIRAAFSIFGGAFLAACAMGQTQSPPSPTPQSQSQTANAAPPAASNDAAIPNGPAVTVELNGSLDSKKAKVGDKVEAHTTEALKSGNDVLVPKGTKLIGHVTQATARSKGDTDSSLAIQFDKAEPKKQQEVPLNVIVLAVAAPAQMNVSGGAPTSGDPMANTQTSAQSSPMGASRQQTPTPNPGAYPQGSASESTDTPGVTGTLPANSRGIYGLKDLKLMMNRSKDNNPSTVITSTGKDVHLDSGTRLLLVTSANAPAASGQ
jgi:hypothetical protein